MWRENTARDVCIYCEGGGVERDSRSKMTHDFFLKTKIKEKGKIKVKYTKNMSQKERGVLVLASIISTFRLDLSCRIIVKA